ncbi:hypothetical protein BDQ17DRAFT_1358379 [Cyathus striatus]|nr:hypothetical protein BDQ17DRAFT_1358379 [Cyathus striatus]
MILKLYGSPHSTATRLAALVLHEKKVPFKFIPVYRINMEHKSKEYLEKKHPFGQVPYIVRASLIQFSLFILYESRAIARYVVAKYPTQGTQGLIPTDLKANALFEQAASTEFANFHLHVYPAWIEGQAKKSLGLEPDQAAVERHLSALDAKLDVYEQILGRQKYLAGNVRLLFVSFYVML